MAYARVIKKGVFDAAHSNYGFGEGHKCSRIHGHGFVYRVAVRAEINEATGLSIDFGVVKEAMKEKVEKVFDHYFLNELPEFKNYPPSAENIARYIFQSVQDYIGIQGELQWVELAETDTSSVLITKEDL